MSKIFHQGKETEAEIVEISPYSRPGRGPAWADDRAHPPGGGGRTGIPRGESTTARENEPTPSVRRRVTSR